MPLDGFGQVLPERGGASVRVGGLTPIFTQKKPLLSQRSEHLPTRVLFSAVDGGEFVTVFSCYSGARLADGAGAGSFARALVGGFTIDLLYQAKNHCFRSGFRL